MNLKKLLDGKHKKNTRLNFIRGEQTSRPSQTNVDANIENIEINPNTAIPKLQETKQLYSNTNDVRGLITDLLIDLGICKDEKEAKEGGASKYGYITKPTNKESSIRISNHNSNASTYKKNKKEYDFNISVVIKHIDRGNTFKKDDKVSLKEFVYIQKELDNVKDGISLLIDSIILFLQTGIYKDLTGVAKTNESKKTKRKRLNNSVINNSKNFNVMKKIKDNFGDVILNNRRRVKDSEKNGIPCTYYYDLTLDLVNPETDDRSEPYERLDQEHFVDFKDQEGWDNFDDCYEAAINRAMEYYFEGVESFADDADIEVEGVSVYIGHIDEGDDYNEEDYTCNLYPKGDEEYFAEHQQFIIV